AADDTRRRLFGSAVHLFSTKGYAATTVDAIAKRAGVAKGTFFLHFATKDAVVIELVRRQTKAARRAREDELPHGPLAALRAAVMALGDQAGQSRELSRAVLAATLENPQVGHDADALFGALMADMLVDAHAIRPMLRSTVHPAELVRGLLAANLGAAFHFASSGTRASMRELLAPLVDGLIEGSLEEAHAKPRRRARAG
ncbi:MAG: TetR/AcrR family transcriptional regulator, partial [Acidobacteriota bacterium]